ncbi:MAG TPA: nicotinate (nicotinamide) nucleotide adenylyltransferase [Spirochaetales bacterium]|nr:nicotinate (nicotinamide) nucleotide adenylyltransferase [Spirochaetales bacterium]HOV37199.1 nicotinate (nicotinamide) nucleotide adenylyltransferase [Spirochaetales bacterium]
MRTALLGGTFNPIHNGHLYIAEEVRISLAYDRIVFVPSFRPAHKEIGLEDDPFKRFEMVRLATGERNEFLVEDCEIQRRETSYTMDTIEYLYKRYPITGKIGLIIGDDLVPGFPRWRRVEDLLKVVDIIVAYRLRREPFPYPVPITYVENLLIPISSSDIRKRVQEGKAFRYLVPEPVYEYICSQGLYRND